MYRQIYDGLMNDSRPFRWISAFLVVSGVFVFLNQVIVSFRYSDLGDFFWVVEFTSDLNPYVDAEKYGHIANYPPLSYVIFYPFYLLASAGGSLPIGKYSWGLISCLLFIIIPLTVTIVFLVKNTSKSYFFSAILIFAILTGYPLYFEVNRANVNIVILMFITIFVLWKDSDVRWKRETAILCLAIAGAMKLYPAFLGILLIRDRRWKDCLKTVVYSAILFIVPFLAFKGGFANIPLFFEALGIFSGENLESFNPYDLSITRFFGSLAVIFGFDESTAAGIGTVVSIVFFILACFVIISVKDEIKAVFLTIAALIIVPSPNYAYTLIYTFIPMSMILGALAGREADAETKEEYLFLLIALGLVHYFTYFFLYITALAYFSYALILVLKKRAYPWSLVLLIF